jgi:steroid 5-alpha reductase family enzyme
MNPLEVLLFLIGLAIPVAVVISCLGFIISLVAKNNGYADVLYPWYFIAIVAVGYRLRMFDLSFDFPLPMAVSNIVFSLVFLWGARLSLRIYRKNRGKPEDFRYAKWRSEWKWFKIRSFFQIYLFQGFIALIIVAPAYLAAVVGFAGGVFPLGFLLAGLSFWLAGFLFESIGDRQLDLFLKDPANRGRIMTSGLWEYSRHPNYFGEALMWWGIWVISLSVVPEIWYLTIVSPMLITFLLTKVSGIPMLEKRWEGNPEWEKYRSRTSAFVPWVPKR